MFRGQGRLRPRAVLTAAVAPLLLLLTPFVVFLRHHDYPLARPEIAVCLIAAAVLAAAIGLVVAGSRPLELVALSALATLFADIQFEPPKGTIGRAAIFVLVFTLLWVVRRHAATIVSLATAAMLVSSLAAPGNPGEKAHRPMAVGAAQLPLLVHLVLDEHLGVAGMPSGPAGETARAMLHDFFARHGFRVFDGAYSQHFTTYRAIGHLLNGTFDRYAPELVEPARGTGHWRLRRSTYFDRLRQRGYALRVYQTDYLDLCPPDTFQSTCETYESTTLRALVPLDLTTREKASVVAGMYLDRSLLYGQVRNLYRAARRSLASVVRVPAWDWERTRLNALSSVPILESVVRDVRQAHRGQAIFAHLLIPHYPYAFDRDCHARPPSGWLERMDRDAPAGTINTEASRRQRYGEYFDQLACLYRRLDRLMSAIPVELRQEAIIIIQGDHGSRIAIHEPSAEQQTLLTTSDLADAYSTLFAVRARPLPAGHDLRMMTTACLLGHLNATNFSDPSAVDTCVTPPGAFLARTDSEDKRPVFMPLPPFTRSEAPRATAPYGPRPGLDAIEKRPRLHPSRVRHHRPRVPRSARTAPRAPLAFAHLA